ncbi:MAG: single-stranded DNA-binding protein [Clostridia bacterium]|nr:single-stranded DNA-binding protein [Clostridia bacterium]MBP3605373.1 single-stranded DNA-binding protein [Clostridia bacterium]
MASFNKVILIGNMTADPELKQTQTGTSVCSFSIAVNRRFSKNEQGQTVDFINIVAWRQSADFVCRYFKKGNPILVCGQLQTRTWTDNQGQKRYATEVVADEVSFVAPAGANASAPMGNAPQGDVYAPAAYGAPAFNTAGSANFEEIPSDESLPF